MFAWVLDAAGQYTGCRQIELLLLLLLLLLRMVLLLLCYRGSCCLLLLFVMCSCRRCRSSRSLWIKICMVVVVVFVVVVVRLHVELSVVLLLVLRINDLMLVVIDEVVLYIVDEITNAVILEGRIDNVRGVWPAQGGLAIARFGNFGDASAAGRLQHPLHNSSLSELSSSC